MNFYYARKKVKKSLFFAFFSRLLQNLKQPSSNFAPSIRCLTKKQVDDGIQEMEKQAMEASGKSEELYVYWNLLCRGKFITLQHESRNISINFK